MQDRAVKSANVFSRFFVLWLSRVSDSGYSLEFNDQLSEKAGKQFQCISSRGVFSSFFRPESQATRAILQAFKANDDEVKEVAGSRRAWTV